MTQLNTTTNEIEYTSAEPADFLPYLARSVARDLTQLTLATADGVPELIAAAAEDAARGVDALIAALMEAEGLSIAQAQARAAGLIAEQGELETSGTRLGELLDELATPR
ncbi:hypothetical protein ACU635_43925 [[Actinomadura] parvosata]|uniref:hypothetical protein n=1 Tax=[Actinomadura] parvosata TaxID=1955412 RepID=UPI00406D1BC3